MFANRAKHLQLLTGYDLLLPASVIESDIWEFCANLNKWKRDPLSLSSRSVNNNISTHCGIRNNYESRQIFY